MSAVLAAPDQCAVAPESTIKVGELKAGAFSRAKQEFTNNKDLIDIINYIDFLAMNNSISADDLDLPFSASQGKKEWKLTKAEATKLFFDHVEAKKAANAIAIKLPDDSEQDRIRRAFQTNVERHRNEWRSTIQACLNDATTRLSQMYDHLAKARSFQERIDASNPGVDRLNDILKAIEGTNWNFTQIRGTVIEFENRADVILRHIEPKAGLNYELNCGRYRLQIEIVNMTPRIYAHKGTVQPAYVPCVHPHVSRHGEVCFGNAQDTVNKAVIVGDVATILRTLDALLPNYGDNPFISIETFKQAIIERDRREELKHGKEDAEAFGEDEECLDDEPFEDEEFDDEGGE